MFKHQGNMLCSNCFETFQLQTSEHLPCCPVSLTGKLGQANTISKRCTNNYTKQLSKTPILFKIGNEKKVLQGKSVSI